MTLISPPEVEYSIVLQVPLVKSLFELHEVPEPYSHDLGSDEIPAGVIVVVVAVVVPVVGVVFVAVVVVLFVVAVGAGVGWTAVPELNAL